MCCLYFCLCIFDRKVKSRNPSCVEGIEKVQTIQAGKPGRLSKGQTFLFEVMESREQPYLLRQLSRLLAESAE